MRKILIAMAILVAGCAASSASAATLTAHRVTAGGDPLGTPGASTFAYVAAANGAHTSAVLRDDDGRSRTIMAPAGCGITTTGGGLMAGRCGEPRWLPGPGGTVATPAFVAAIDGSSVTRFDMLGQGDAGYGSTPSGPIAVGTRWVTESTFAYHGGDHVEAFDWHAGTVVPSHDDQATAYDDLDAPSGTATLCAPLRRVWFPGEDMGQPAGYLPVTVSGRYALVQTSSADQDTLVTYRLGRCGSSKPVALPKGFAPFALGHGWVAGTTKVAHRSPRVDVVRLSTGRRTPVAGVPGEITRTARAGTFALTQGRLYVSGLVAGRRPIYTVKLPTR